MYIFPVLHYNNIIVYFALINSVCYNYNIIIIIILVLYRPKEMNITVIQNYLVHYNVPLLRLKVWVQSSQTVSVAVASLKEI